MAAQSLNYYLAEAQLAINYTKMMLPWGSTDRTVSETAANAARTGGATVIAQIASRLAQKAWQSGSEKQEIEHIAKLAKMAKVGTCIEYAAIAAIFLRDRRVLPVEYMCLMKGGTTVHRIVVLGREAADGERMLPGNPQTWKGPAVICDAWEGRPPYRAGSRPIACSPGGLVVKGRWD